MPPTVRNSGLAPPPVFTGEEIVITRSGEPLVKLVPARRRARPNFGFARGQVTIAPDFDDIPDEFAP